MDFGDVVVDRLRLCNLRCFARWLLRCCSGGLRVVAVFLIEIRSGMMDFGDVVVERLRNSRWKV